MPAKRPSKEGVITPKKARKGEGSPPKPPKANRHKEWKESLVLWTHDSPQLFKHPDGVRTITKTNAASWYKLRSADLDTLPYEEGPNRYSYSRPMRLYSVDAVERLAKQKCKHFGRVYEANDPFNGGVGWIRLTEQQADNISSPRERSVAMHERPEPKPLLLHGHTSADASDPPSDQIVWGGCNRVPWNLMASDACLLFNITPGDIQDLTNVSPWVHTCTVAMRAVQLHGGLKAHNDLIHTKLSEEIRELERQHLGQSRNHFSAQLRLVLEPNPNEWLYQNSQWEPHVCNANCVAQYFPPTFVSTEDHGCGGYWQ